MKHEDLIKKLENLKTPDIELIDHKRALKMALLSSGRFKKRTIMDWTKMLAPVATAVLVVAVMGVLAVVQPNAVFPPTGDSQISKFSSYWELENFIKTNTQNTLKRNGSFWAMEDEGAVLAPADAGSSTADYSTTNIQVAGVDEADIVKTDGDYIYVASGNRTIIVKAYPPEQAQVLSEIELEGTVIGIFINGDKLVVFGEETPYYLYYDYYDEPVTREYAIMPYISPSVIIKVYDISDRENPQLEKELSTEGQYISSRMIGDYAYVVINESVYEEDEGVSLPKIYSDGMEKEIPATDIYYSDVADYYYTYTTIIAINVQDSGEEPTYETILLGASSNLYVSTDNIYLTFPVWGGYVGDSQKTSIHRIHIDGSAINYTASGEVPGTVLNQFSMDEYNDYFRVATTTWDGTSQNNVYILNMSLNITGQLTDLASRETIYSVRFMGERCYMVTFRSIDPLFVIDLSNPTNPTVLGELKVTGYSGYLHPYDENHVIGIGKETVAESEDFAWYQGIKISLFDVSDFNEPKEIGHPYIIGDRGTDSPILWDHKALLFDKFRNLMVIPVLVREIDESDYPESEYPEGIPASAYGRPVWQGAYVLDISLAGIGERGRITHAENITDPEQGYYYYYSPFEVERSLYIGDVLYTVSQARIKMNDLENLNYISEVKLPYSTWTPSDYLLYDSRSEESIVGAPSGGKALPE